jgi:sec-independent protein translocase protein TatA
MLEGLFQPMHLIVILAIALLVVGPKKLPELGAGIGKSIREFKKAMSGLDKSSIDTAPAGEVKQEMKKDTKDAG